MDKLIPLALGVAVAVAIIVVGFRRDTERKGIVARAVEWVRPRAAGGAGTSLYVKQSGTGTAGWVRK